MGTIIFLCGIPSAYGLTGNLKVAGKDFLDAADFLASNVLLPIGGLFIALFVGWLWSDEAKKEISNQGDTPFGLTGIWIWICRIVAPVAIGYIFLSGVGLL
jgi:NSS family neurotransmitter:Na+ symporter